MIPGDIDLTEKLDFRRVVKREIPQLPAKWNNENTLNVKNNSFCIDSSSYISIPNNGSNYNITVSYNNK